MIEFVSRKFVFKQCPLLAQQLMDYQQAAFDPSEYVYVEGEEVFLSLDDNLPTILTKKKAAELNIEHANYCMSVRDEFERIPTQAAWFERIIAELNVPSFNVFTKNIGQSIVKLTLALGWDDIIVICDTKSPYLAQENPHKPVKQAVQNLMRMGMTRTSSEGVKLNQTNSPEFFASIFWIVRCNASAPGIYFSSPNSNIIGTLCKYGNIHFESYGQVDSDLLRGALKAAGFWEVPNRICHENFSASGTIDGRKLSVE